MIHVLETGLIFRPISWEPADERGEFDPNFSQGIFRRTDIAVNIVLRWVGNPNRLSGIAAGFPIASRVSMRARRAQPQAR